jgi:hypothetical protein
MGKGGKGQSRGPRAQFAQFAPRAAAPTISSRRATQPRVPTNAQPPAQGTPAASDSGRASDSAARRCSRSNAGPHHSDTQHQHATSGAHSSNGGQDNTEQSTAVADGSSTSSPGRHEARPLTGTGRPPSDALPTTPTPTRTSSASSSPHTGETPATASAGAVSTDPHRPKTTGGAQAPLGTTTSKNSPALITQLPTIPEGLTPTLTGHVVRHFGKASDTGCTVIVYAPALRRHFAHKGRLSWSPRSGCGVIFKPSGDTLKVQGVKLPATERLTPRRKLDPAPSEWVSTTLQRSGHTLRLEMSFPSPSDDPKPIQTHLELHVTQGGQPPYPSGTPLRVQVGVHPTGPQKGDPCLLGAQLDLAALRRKIPTQLHPDELTQLGADTLVLGGLGDRDARLGSRHLPLGDILTHPTRTLDEWDMTKALLALASANDLPRTPVARGSPDSSLGAQPHAEDTPPRPIVVVVLAEGGRNFLREWHRRINLWYDGSCRDGLSRAPLAIRQRFQFHLIAPVEARVNPTTAQAFLPMEFMHDTSGAWNYARRLRLQDHLVATFKVAPDPPPGAPQCPEGPATPTYIQTGQDMRLAVLDYTWEKAEPTDCNISIPTALHQDCAFSSKLVPSGATDPGLMEVEAGGDEEVIDIALPPAQGVIVEFDQRETTLNILEGILKHAAAGSAAGVQVSNIHSFRGADHGAIIQGPAGFDFAGLAQYLNGRAAQPTFNAMPLSNFFSKSAIDLWLDDRATISTTLLRRLFGPKATFYQNGPHAVRVYLPADHRMRHRETLVEGLSTFNKSVGDSGTTGAAHQGKPGQRQRQRSSQPFFKSFTLSGRTTWLLRERPHPRRQWDSPETAQRAADPSVRLLFGVDSSVPSAKVVEVLLAIGVPKATAQAAFRVQTRHGSHMVALRLGPGASPTLRTVRLGGSKAWLGLCPPTLELADKGPLISVSPPPSIKVMVGVLEERLGLQTPLTSSRGSSASRPKIADSLLTAATTAHQHMEAQASTARKVDNQVRNLSGLTPSSSPPLAAHARSSRRTTPPPRSAGQGRHPSRRRPGRRHH